MKALNAMVFLKCLAAYYIANPLIEIKWEKYVYCYWCVLFVKEFLCCHVLGKDKPSWRMSLLGQTFWRSSSTADCLVLGIIRKSGSGLTRFGCMRVLFSLPTWSLVQNIWSNYRLFQYAILFSDYHRAVSGIITTTLDVWCILPCCPSFSSFTVNVFAISTMAMDTE